MKGQKKGLVAWFEHRLQLRKTIGPMLRHPVPRNLGWKYVFGSATMTLFIVQVVTGIILAFVYVPSADEAYQSLEYLNEQHTLGWLLRGIHFWGSSAMVFMMFAHLTRVFLTGAFKFPRELTWLMGVGLFVCTLGLAFSGQVLRWDADAYWGVGVGAAMMGRLPILAKEVVHLVLGGQVLGAATLSRFFALHVFILPGLLGAFLAVHLYLVLKLGISSPPKPGQRVDPKTYHEQYEKLLENGEPFYPNAAMKDAVFSALTVLALVAMAWYLGPKGPSGPPDPTVIPAEPRPDWWVMPIFALLALSPRWLEPFLMLGLPLCLLVIMILIPLLARYGERSPLRRPVAVVTVILLVPIYWVLLAYGYWAPWSPHMHAWSGTPVPPSMLKGLSPEELMGAVVFQNKTCRNCHSLDGKGGKRGPDLTTVATLLNHNELVRQVIQGGGLMPAYGKQLRPAEVEALVAFLDTLRPKDEPRPRQTGPKEIFPGESSGSTTNGAP